MLTHVMAQPELKKGDGPIALILAPTHELAEQIVKEARRLRARAKVRARVRVRRRAASERGLRLERG
jgi:superfamily II DNA/RNA helicase